MKPTFLLSLLLLLPFITDLAAQTDDAPRSLFSQASLQKVRYTCFLPDAGYDYRMVGNTGIHGGGFALTVLLNERFVTGLSFSFSSTRQLSLPSPVKLINPRYNYNFSALHNEFLIAPRGVVYPAVILRAGLGHVAYQDKANLGAQSYYYNTETGEYQPTTASGSGPVADDAFFVLEPGLKLYANITPHIAIGAGGHYRFAWGVDKAGTDRDLSQYAFSASLRFRLKDTE